MSLSEGMDLARVREVAGQIRTSAQTAGDVRQQGDGQLAILREAWSGTDLEQFDKGWTSQSPALERMAEALRRAADDLLGQAEQQESASGGAGTPGNGGWTDRTADEPWWTRFADKDFGKDILDSEPDDEDEEEEEDDDGNLFSRAKDKVGDVVDEVKDTAGDVKDFGTDVIDTAKDTAGDVKDGLDWLGGEAKDGLAWLGGQATEGLSWIGQQAKSVAADVAQWLDGIGDGFIRNVEAQVNLLGQFTQIFTEGRLPRISEVVASVLMVGGTGVGVLTNILTGADRHILDDGHGRAGEVTELGDSQVSNDAGTHPELRPPTSLDEILRSTSDAYEVRGEDGSGSVRVTEVTKDGETSYIVNVPGTERWWPHTDANPLDLTGNLASISGEQTAAMQAVQDALTAAGVESDDPVMLVGHSQGGIITNALLSDPAFTDDFNVTHSVTYGSPVDGFDIPDDVQALNLQHRGDVVPRLDLGDHYLGLPNVHQMFTGNGPGETRVVLDSPGWGINPIDNHSHALYANSVQASHDPALQAYEEGLDNFIVGEHDGSQVSGRDVELRREYDD
ncbi:PGAP1-like alpha/beta domain-containing protein [Janibacter limosus]|uniref:PGAP1-like alpha/beta domain-containing protein n=1 Tax=Janibacter limosus TaxID=53458 RepID=UPI000AC45EEA|nr:WXG100 family type VII secretion target [Janibacter limosus]